MTFHSKLTGDAAIHEIMYVQASAPGAVGAKKYWMDTSGGDSPETGAILKQRNAGDTGWDVRADLSNMIVTS